MLSLANCSRILGGIRNRDLGLPLVSPDLHLFCRAAPRAAPDLIASHARRSPLQPLEPSIFGALTAHIASVQLCCALRYLLAPRRSPPLPFAWKSCAQLGDPVSITEMSVDPTPITVVCRLHPKQLSPSSPHNKHRFPCGWHPSVSACRHADCAPPSTQFSKTTSKTVTVSISAGMTEAICKQSFPKNALASNPVPSSGCHPMWHSHFFQP